MWQKARFMLWDGDDMISNAIRIWRPGILANEKAYESALFDHLQIQLDELSFSRQFAIGNAIADIAVERELLIEIKNKLDSKSKYDRLVGQLIEYEGCDKPLIVVICGDSHNQYIEGIRKALDRLSIATELVYLPREIGRAH